MSGAHEAWLASVLAVGFGGLVFGALGGLQVSRRQRERGRDLDAVRGLLRLELEDGSRLPPSRVTRELGGDVHAVLVLEHPTSTVPVGRDVADAWNTTDDVLFAIAVENLRRVAAPAEVKQGPYRMFVGDDCTAARVLVDVAAGSVVAMPSREVLLVMASRTALMMAGPMLLAAHGIFVRASRPVRPDLFVWWGDRLHPVGVYRGSNGGITFLPPADVASDPRGDWSAAGGS